MADERYGRGDGPRNEGYGRDRWGGGDRSGGGYRAGTSGGGDARGGWDRGGGDRYGQRGGGDDRYSPGGYAQGGGDQGRDSGRAFSGGDDYYRGDQDRGGDRARGGQGGYGQQPQGYGYQDRGFVQRAGDEVRSWFGDEEAERRREADARYDENQSGRQPGRDTHHHDRDYHDWRNQQIASFDRDYAEYRQENQSKFHNEFSTWRTARQGQRSSLDQVEEHMEVVGSDGEHIGTVDKVRDDRIILTKNDADAGGRHHSVPSRWIQSVEGKVMLSKTAAEAKQQWRDEERSGAMFGQSGQSNEAGQSGQAGDAAGQGGRDAGGTDLNRSFRNTY